MDIKERFNKVFTQVKDAAVNVAGFVKARPRASIAVAVGLLIVGPLLTGTGGESFFVNLVGLGIAALVVRRIVQAGDRRKAAQARQSGCRCHCRQQGPQQQTATTQQP